MADYIRNLPESPYVFLSYSPSDRKKVEVISRFLEQAGFHCWIDDRIRAMESFNTAIENAIENCHLFLAFCSASYMEKNYCRTEYDCAINNARSRMLVCLDDVLPGDDPEKKYFFTYLGAIGSILGRNEGVGEDEESLRKFTDKIVDSPFFYSLSRIMGGDEEIRLRCTPPTCFWKRCAAIRNGSITRTVTTCSPS
ncbi:MAG: toll/interleukin-1 receptor domain-containing protein [Clostridia bacterium]|nr:toll/interleukin-1 receptor domain-containing protein [Clostridia bacterium]